MDRMTDHEEDMPGGHLTTLPWREPRGSLMVMP
jgi:hypothetical protein